MSKKKEIRTAFLPFTTYRIFFKIFNSFVFKVFLFLLETCLLNFSPKRYL